MCYVESLYAGNNFSHIETLREKHHFTSLDKLPHVLSCKLNSKQNWPLGQKYAFQVDKLGGTEYKGLQMIRQKE